MGNLECCVWLAAFLAKIYTVPRVSQNGLTASSSEKEREREIDKQEEEEKERIKKCEKG